jgi:hypothetical protein
MTTALTHIPPTRQSTVETMACPHSYGAQFIEGRRTADSTQSYRGTEVHEVMRKYVAHCAERQVPADWKAFDDIAAAISIEAGRICDGLRDSYKVDYQHVVAVEELIMLDEDFQPIDLEHPKTVAHQGKPDVIFALDETSVQMDDYKSHPVPFDPDTPQSLMYPVLVMQKMPWVQSVTFRLVFVRYPNCFRAVTWTRNDLPKMMAEMSRYRRRQESYHATYEAEGLEALPAIPHAGCHYCPLLQFGDCPVAEVNPNTQEPDMLVRELVFMEKRAGFVKEILKGAIQARGGAIVARDANGTEMSYGPADKQRTAYPAAKVLPVIQRWCVAAGDQAFLNSINLSSTTVKSKLDTNKRRSLQHEVERLVTKTTKVETRLTTANIGEAEPEEEW